MRHATTSTAWTDHTDMPCLLGGVAFEREHVQSHLIARLLTPKPGQSPHAVLTGRPGGGKTQAAAQYAWHQQRHYGGHCYLVDASSPTSLHAWAAEKASALGLQSTQLRHVVNALTQRHPTGPTLLVLDDAYSIDDLRLQLRLLPRLHLLFTSPIHHRTSPDCLNLSDSAPTTQQEDGTRFLQANVDGLSQLSARALAQHLHAHALALHLASALLRHSTGPVERTARALIDAIAAPPAEDDAPSTSPEQHVVNALWRRCAPILHAASPHALRMLETCAFLHGPRIPHALIERPPGDPFATPPVTTLMPHLLTLGLANQHSRDHLTMHPMVQRAVRDSMSPGNAELALQRAFQGIVRFQPPHPKAGMPQVIAWAKQRLDRGLRDDLPIHRRRQQARYLQTAGEQMVWVDHQHHQGLHLVQAATDALAPLAATQDRVTQSLAYQSLGSVQRLLAYDGDLPPDIQHTHLAAAEASVTKAYTTLEALPAGSERDTAFERLASAISATGRRVGASPHQLKQTLTFLKDPAWTDKLHASSWWQLAQQAAALGPGQKALQEQVVVTLTQHLKRSSCHAHCQDQPHHLTHFATQFVALCAAVGRIAPAQHHLKMAQAHIKGMPDSLLQRNTLAHLERLKANLVAIETSQRRLRPHTLGTTRPAASRGARDARHKRRRAKARQTDLRALLCRQRLPPAPPQGRKRSDDDVTRQRPACGGSTPHSQR